MNKSTETQLREALEFYADPANWSGIGLMLRDEGKLARKALNTTVQDDDSYPTNMVDLTLEVEPPTRNKRQNDYLDHLAANIIPSLIKRVTAIEDELEEFKSHIHNRVQQVEQWRPEQWKVNKNLNARIEALEHKARQRADFEDWKTTDDD